MCIGLVFVGLAWCWIVYRGVCLGCGFASWIRRPVWFCFELGFELCICLVCWIAYLLLLCCFVVCCLSYEFGFDIVV